MYTRPALEMKMAKRDAFRMDRLVSGFINLSFLLLRLPKEDFIIFHVAVGASFLTIGFINCELSR